MQDLSVALRARWGDGDLACPSGRTPESLGGRPHSLRDISHPEFAVHHKSPQALYLPRLSEVSKRCFVLTNSCPGQCPAVSAVRERGDFSSLVESALHCESPAVAVAV